MDNERAKILLKATYDILKEQDKSRYVLNSLETTAIWDEAECDGYCLMEEISELLEIEDQVMAKKKKQYKDYQDYLASPEWKALKKSFYKNYE